MPTNFSGVSGNSHLLPTSAPCHYHFSSVTHSLVPAAALEKPRAQMSPHWIVLGYVIDGSSPRTQRSRGTMTGRGTPITSPEPAEPLTGLLPRLSWGATSPTVNGRGSPWAHRGSGQMAGCVLCLHWWPWLIHMHPCICLSMGPHAWPHRWLDTSTRSGDSLAWSSNSSFPLEHWICFFHSYRHPGRLHSNQLHPKLEQSQAHMLGCFNLLCCSHAWILIPTSAMLQGFTTW